MSDAEVKMINILYYARVSTDLKLTEPFEIEIHQFPPIYWSWLMDGSLVDLYSGTRFCSMEDQNPM